MLAVTGGKGGCGKTTTVLGLARTLARRGMEPLVLDADCDMPDLHHLAGIERAEGVDALVRGAPLARACRYPDAFTGVAVVTAGRPGRTGPALRATRDWAGPVLVDCPAGIGPDATRPLRHADAALVVSTDEPQSLGDTRRTITAARQLDAPPVGVLLRAVSGRPAETPARVAGAPVLAAAPEVADPLDAAPLSQVWSTVADRLLADTPVGARTHTPASEQAADGGHPGHRTATGDRCEGHSDSADGHRTDSRPGHTSHPDSGHTEARSVARRGGDTTAGPDGRDRRSSPRRWPES
jgi:septum site-determining protein MinD